MRIVDCIRVIKTRGREGRKLQETTPCAHPRRRTPLNRNDQGLKYREMECLIVNLPWRHKRGNAIEQGSVEKSRAGNTCLLFEKSGSRER